MILCTYLISYLICIIMIHTANMLPCKILSHSDMLKYKTH